MPSQADPRREPILAAARGILAADPAAPVAVIAAAAGVSRATFYRRFPTRAALLDALDIAPDPGAAERILAAALELLARDGLARLSMDDLAGAAGVSRASVYRIYPGKAALFAALLSAEAPFTQIAEVVHRMHARPPAEVLPVLLGILSRDAAPRIGIIRALMFEVTAGTPEAVEAAEGAVRPMLGGMTGYLAGQMEAGTIRRMHPLLAAQVCVGPFIFHLVSRSIAGSLVGLDVELAEVADEFARVALLGLAPEPTEE